MSSNVYSTGLRNVGSYLASGQPFVVRQTVNAGDEVKIEFPFVTKNIKIRIPKPPNASLGYLANGGATTRLFTNGALTAYGSTGTDFTFSNWLKGPSFASNKQPYRLNNNVADQHIRYKFRSTNAIRFEFINSSGAGVWTTSQFTLTNPNDWHHYLITQVTGNVHVYIDGVHKDNNSAGTAIPDPLNDINIPPNLSAGNLTTAVHDEICFFTSGFLASDVTSLYNYGEWFNPLNHRLSSDLEAWWTCGDFAGDSLGPSASDVVINDAADTVEDDLTLFGSHDAHKSFEPGPFQKQQTGKLRVHLLSTGSASGANIISNKHYKELQGYGSSIEIPAKTKEIYLTGVGAQTTFEVIAELTNIPTGSMYSLTGSGIDE